MGTAFAGKRKVSRKIRWDCGVPLHSCQGAIVTTNMNTPYKAHGDFDNARRCQKAYQARPENSNLDMFRPIQMKTSKGNTFLPPKMRG